MGNFRSSGRWRKISPSEIEGCWQCRAECCDAIVMQGWGSAGTGCCMQRPQHLPPWILKHSGPSGVTGRTINAPDCLVLRLCAYPKEGVVMQLGCPPLHCGEPNLRKMWEPMNPLSCFHSSLQETDGSGTSKVAVMSNGSSSIHLCSMTVCIYFHIFWASVGNTRCCEVLLFSLAI